MNNFAKLFESEMYGQILVKLDQSDEPGEGAEIRFYFSPPDLGVCSIALKYRDTDNGWDKSEQVFYDIDLEQSESIIKSTYDSLIGVIAP